MKHLAIDEILDKLDPDIIDWCLSSEMGGTNQDRGLSPARNRCFSIQCKDNLSISELSCN
jgi:hypothetical protein